MSVRGAGGAAPLRLWLALALAAIVIAPVLATWALEQSLNAWQQGEEQAHWSAIRAAIGENVARWHAPAWQRQSLTTFAALGVEAALVDKRPSHGGLAFATPGASQYLAGSGLLPAFAPRRRQIKRATGSSTHLAATTSVGDAVAYREISILGRAVSGARVPVAGVANLWFVRSLATPLPAWIAPTGGFAALLAALTVVAVCLNRAVLRPLTALSAAARQVGEGTLDPGLPASAAREVAEVVAAMEIMSRGLRDATRRQAGMEQERRLFIGTVAHDLRTPLFTLSAYLSGLRDRVATTPEKADHYLAVCQEQTAQLEHLVADLFAFATIEYLEQEPQREPLELGDVLRRAVEHLQPRAETSGVALLVADPSVPCPITGDARLLTRAIENLLDNALRYTPAGGQVEVRWRSNAQARTALFVVEDTGPGLAEQDLPHVFTPLYRGEASRNRQTGGTGLGLAIARRIMQAHGGDLTAGNRLAGGAVFTATLPVD
jgi:signal transduction histidine kinase